MPMRICEAGQKTISLLFARLFLVLVFAAFIFSDSPSVPVYLLLGTLLLVSFLYCLFRSHLSCGSDERLLLKEAAQIQVVLFCAALVVVLRNYDYFLTLCGGLISSAIVIGVTILMGISLHSIRILSQSHKINIRKNKVKDILPCIILCCIVLFSSLSIFHSWMRSDTYGYYYAFEEVDVRSINTSAARLAGHISYTYTIIGFTVNQLLNNYELSLHMINLVLFIGSIICFYRLLQHLISTGTHKSTLLISLTALYAFNPLSYGLLSTISIDNIALYLLVICIYLSVADRKVLSFAAFIGMIFTKETMVVVAAAGVLGLLIGKYQRFRRSANQELFATIMQLIADLVPLLIVAGLWLYAYVNSPWSGAGSSQYFTLDGSPVHQFNTFGINFDYIIDKLTTLLSNFNWAILICIVIGSCIVLHRCHQEPTGWTLFQRCIPFILMTVAIGAYNLFYITYNNFRYWQPIIVTLLIIYAIVVCPAFSPNIASGITVVLAALVLVSSYITIDPWMLKNLPIASTGNFVIASSRNTVMKQTEFYFGDVYNRQTLAFDSALDEALSSIDFSSNDLLLFSDEYRAPSDGGGVGSLSIINGFGYSGMPTPRYVCWNGSNRYLSDSLNRDVLHIAYVDDNFDINSQEMKNYRRIIYIEMPWGDTYFRDIILGHGKTVDSIYYAGYGWKFNIYTIGI